MDDPLVTVVVPTKNSARTLERCLRLIRSQSYPAIELVVVDNHSVDATPTIARSFADLFVSAGPERCTQRNIGAARGTGAYVAFIDSDLYLASDTIAACVAAMDASSPTIAIIPERSIGSGFWTQCKAFERSFYVADAHVSAARFFPRAIFEQIGGYDESLIAGEDWDISMRASARARPVFAATLAEHDEGTLDLRGTFMKKRYYGRYIARFTHKHGAAGAAKFSPLRSAMILSLRRIPKQPLVVAGMYVMKASEAVGLLLGMLSARLFPEPANETPRR